jgi:diguanylate cyclase (GGDEF)-like protein
VSGNSLYPLLSTGLILVIMFINYFQKTDTDHYQRRICLFVLAAIFAAISAHFAGSMLENKPGNAVHIFLTIIFNFFIFFQQSSYYLVVVFLDYLINKNNLRTQKFIYIIIGFMFINILILALNYFIGFYFSITDNNHLVYSSFFLVRFYMSYSAVLIAIINIFLSARQLRTSLVYLIIFFSLLCGTGALLDIIVPGGNLIWAFLVSAILISYFYIIHSDTTQDAVTGIGNRSGFLEFINRIISSNTRQSYAIAMIDINNLKKIKTAYGTSAGDKALAEIAAIIKKCTRQYDYVARLGEDEFLVAIKAKFDINRLLGRILNSLEKLNQEPDRQYHLSISYAYNVFSTPGDQSIDDFLQRLNELVFQYRSDHKIEERVKHREAGI